MRGTVGVDHWSGSGVWMDAIANATSVREISGSAASVVSPVCHGRIMPCDWPWISGFLARNGGTVYVYVYLPRTGCHCLLILDLGPV
jgi:hypothetical protein